MGRIEIPNLLFWENKNTWYGSSGQARFFLRPVWPEEGAARLEAELWRGPMARALSQTAAAASFPLDGEGLARLAAWLEEQSARINGER